MSAAPIYLPEAPASPELRSTEAALRLLEGALTVAGVQYQNESDASLARRREAEKRLREAKRIIAKCAWCGVGVDTYDAVLEIGSELIHDGKCSSEFDVFVYGHELEGGECVR